MKTKKFDCVEMKRRGAEHVYSATKDLTPEQELEYWRLRTEELRKERAATQAKAPHEKPARTKRK